MRFPVLLLFILILFQNSCSFTVTDTEENSAYSWHQSYAGGGGYITGMIQDPSNPDILYARSDVAGVFKSVDGGQTWKVKNKGMTKAHHHNVESICLSPHHPKILFRASGDARNSSIFGSIHKSVDGGESWYKVTDSVDYYGNGPDRMFGETIAVDPFDENFVVAGGYSKGLWLSHDGGETWNYCGLSGKRIGLVTFHPYIKNLLYVGTIGDLGIYGGKKAWEEGRLDEYISKHHDFPRGMKGALYISADKGETWKELISEEGFDFCEIKFHPQNPYLITALFPNLGIYQSFDGGRSFYSVMSNLPDDVNYCSIEVDTNNENRIYAAAYTPSSLQDRAPIPIYRTDNLGESWELIKNHKKKDLINYPSYIRFPVMAGWAISDILVDKVNSGKLFYSNWYGVAQSVDMGETWNAYHYGGLETMCIENIQTAKKGKKVYYTAADHSPLYSENGGSSYEHLPKNKKYNASSAFTDSKLKPQFLLFGGVNRHTRNSAILSSAVQDTLKVMKEFPKGHFIQALEEDPHYPGTFWAYVDGDLSKAAGIYKSEDWGASWDRIPFEIDHTAKTLPVNKYFIESELLSIAVYQQKNVNGSNQLLEVDPFRKNTLYVGERTEGIFISNDFGKSWINKRSELPFKKDTASVLMVIKTDPLKRGRIYAGFIREGLWRSEDYGQNWEKIYPLDNSETNVTSLAINPKNNKEIYIAGEPLFWSPSPPILKVSHDEGESWRDIYDEVHGALRIKSIAYDSFYERIHVATSGNGCYYVQKSNP